MDVILTNLAGNKLFTGLILLMSNIGGKYLSLDMPKNVETLFLNSMILRLLALFSVLFLSTRDIKISILLLLLYVVITKFVINEKSSFCLIKENKNANNIIIENLENLQSNQNFSENKKNQISKLDYINAKYVVDKFEYENFTDSINNSKNLKPTTT